MASDGEDDYLSDKFLLESVAKMPERPVTYAERRKQAQRQSEIKNAQNRFKSRREREAEALEEGLRQSLFERAKEEEQMLGAKNKAMDMMLKMGFRPGESLGRSDGSGPSGIGAEDASAVVRQEPTYPTKARSVEIDSRSRTQSPEPQHRTAPLAIDIRTGKKGVGLGKRPPSPDTAERLAKVARIDEEKEKETYRSRTREAFEERRALGQLNNAQRTLIALDEKADIQFNILSLDPHQPEMFPSELVEALAATYDVQNTGAAQENESERLRRQMQMDALQPLEGLSADTDDDGDRGIEPLTKDILPPPSLSEESIANAREFLQMGARDRLTRVLQHLRERYHYCFWCGTQYNDKDDLDDNCPGEEEEVHD